MTDFMAEKEFGTESFLVSNSILPGDPTYVTLPVSNFILPGDLTYAKLRRCFSWRLLRDKQAELALRRSSLPQKQAPRGIGAKYAEKLLGSCWG